MARSRRKRNGGTALEIDDDGFVHESNEGPEEEDTDEAGSAEASQDESRSGFGVWLQRARQAQQLSLDDVAHLTKIRRAILEALEREARNELPEKVFVLGYVRSYAACVQVDVEEAQRRFQAAWGDDDEDEFGAGVAAQRGRSWAWVPPTLASIFAAGVFWYIASL